MEILIQNKDCLCEKVKIDDHDPSLVLIKNMLINKVAKNENKVTPVKTTSKNGYFDRSEYCYILAKEKLETKKNPVVIDSMFIQSGYKVQNLKTTPTLTVPSLIGSPLGCSFSLDAEDSILDDENNKRYMKDECLTDVSPNKSNFMPLTIYMGRKFLNQLNAALIKECVNSNSAWAICDGSDNDKTMFLGTSIQKPCNKDEQFLEKTFHKISYPGLTSIKHDINNIDEILKKHTRIAGIKKSCLIANAYAVYNFTGTDENLERRNQSFLKLNHLNQSKNVENASSSSEFQACFSWPTPRRLFESPPVTSGTLNSNFKLGYSFLRAKIYPGDPKMPCNDLYLEMKMLKGLASGLCGNAIIWEGFNQSGDMLEIQLKKLIEIFKHHGPRAFQSNSKSTKNNESTNSAKDFGVSEMPSRNDIDFTDMLWSTIAGNVFSFSELCKSLLYVFETIQQEEIRPYIYTKNKTRVAEVIQAIIRDGSGINKNVNLVTKCLIDAQLGKVESQLPLIMLVEMGFEKLQRDYFHSLLASSLAVREDLQPFMISGQINDCNTNVEDSLQKLEKLHYVHELVSLCQTYLPSNQTLLQSVVRQALQILTSQTIKAEFHQFEIDVRVDQIHSLLKKMPPSKWKCSFENDYQKNAISAMAGLLNVRTTCEFSLERPISLSTEFPSDYSGNFSSDKNAKDVSSHTPTMVDISKKISFDDKDNSVYKVEGLCYYQVICTSITRLVPNL